MFEDLEAVPGESAVVFDDTQKINYLLSAIKHKRTMQPVYVQIQTDQLRGRITFEQACEDLRYRCETNRADELLGTTARTTKVRGLVASGDLPLCTIHSHFPTTPVLITTANKRQNSPANRQPRKGSALVLRRAVILLSLPTFTCAVFTITSAFLASNNMP